MSEDDVNDYRCLNGHVFAAPDADHGGPWSTLPCPVCGATGLRHFSEDDEARSGGADEEAR